MMNIVCIKERVFPCFVTIRHEILTSFKPQTVSPIATMSIMNIWFGMVCYLLVTDKSVT